MCHVCICFFLQALVVVNMCSISRPDSMTLSWPAVTRTLQKIQSYCYVCHWRLGDLSQGCCQVRIFLLYQCVYIILLSTYYRTYPQDHCVYNTLQAYKCIDLSYHTLVPVATTVFRGSVLLLEVIVGHWYVYRFVVTSARSTRCFLEYANLKSLCVFVWVL